MSAVNILVQASKGVVHLLTDGIAYDENGIVQMISPKCRTIPHADCAIASMGAGRASLVFATELGEKFSSFDAIVENAEEDCRDIYQTHAGYFGQSQFADVNLVLAGWSRQRSRPECYVIQLSDGASDDHWARAHEVADAIMYKPFVLQPAPDIGMNPPPPIEMIEAAHFPSLGSSAQEITDRMSPDDMLHLMEIQRRMKSPLRKGLEAYHWVGGFALLTSIDSEGISQRVMHRWSEDQVGAVVTPSPMKDWRAWRAARTVPTAGVTLMSRAKRELMERKARKGTRG